MEIVFSQPRNLYFLLFIPLLIVMHYVVLRYTHKKGVIFANFDAMSRVSKKYLPTQNNFQLIFRIVAIASLVFAISGTIIVVQSKDITPTTIILIDGADYMFESGQINQAKAIAKDIVDSKYILSRVGIISFTSISQVESPLGLSKTVLQSDIDGIQPSPVGGSDIGVALINAVSILEPVEGDKQVLILTGAQTNFGTQLAVAGQTAREQQIPVYTYFTAIQNTERAEYIRSSLGLIGNLTDGGVLEDYEQIKQPGDMYIPIETYLMILSLVVITLEWTLSRSIYKTIPYD